jgi:23S rRNA (uridine2552-2'-O)-methyltransferase
MARRSRSSERWLREHHADPYVQRARAEGWRSRAIYKLEEIDRTQRLLRPGMLVLDLGAAPGAWSQYARQRVGRAGRVVASDILPMEALPGVEFVQGDLRESAHCEQLLAALGHAQVDVVLSDMAPNLSGLDAIDAPQSLYLAELALDLSQQVLKPQGAALIKLLQGVGFEAFIVVARRAYRTVKLLKPKASRSRSPETYLLASGRRMV